MDDLRERKRRPVTAADLENQPATNVRKISPAKSMQKKVLMLLAVVSVLFVLYLVVFPSPIDARTIHFPDTLPYFEGPLEPNTKLQSAAKIFEGQVKGPESMAMDQQGNIYTGLFDGRIVRLSKDGEMMLVARTGETLPECGSYDAEPRCGRPLGMRFNKKGDRLIVCDAYKGLLSVDVFSGIVEVLLKSEVGMDGHPFMFLNDLTIGSDETIYFTDSSWKWSRRDNRYLVLEGGGHGRILSLNPETKKQAVLLSGLYFPNGIELSKDEMHLVVCETTIARIIRFHIKGAHRGVYDLFNDNLPGLPDNIRRHSAGGYWVGIAAIRKWPFSIIDTIAPYPALRSVIAKIVSQETLTKIFPKYGIILHLDNYGDIMESYQDPSGAVIGGVSEVLEDEDNSVIYLGSYQADYVGKLAINKRDPIA